MGMGNSFLELEIILEISDYNDCYDLRYLNYIRLLIELI